MALRRLKRENAVNPAKRGNRWKHAIVSRRCEVCRAIGRSDETHECAHCKRIYGPCCRSAGLGICGPCADKPGQLALT